MKLFGICIDKRVIGGVVAAAGLLWWLAPGAFAAALPLLVLAICPVSMLLMMKAMNMGQAGEQSAASTPSETPSPSPEATSGSDAAAVLAAATDADARRN